MGSGRDGKVSQLAGVGAGDVEGAGHQWIVKSAQLAGRSGLGHGFGFFCLQVFFPAQQLGLQGLSFRLGDHALVLIQDGEASVRQDFHRGPVGAIAGPPQWRRQTQPAPAARG